MPTAEASASTAAEPETLPQDPARLALLERGLYPYHDGTRGRVGDQLVIQLRLAEACPGGDLAALDKLLETLARPHGPEAEAEAEPVADRPGTAGPPIGVEALRAAVALVPIVGAAFDLPPLGDDGAGLSSRERLDLLADFLVATYHEGDEDDEGDGDEPAPVPMPDVAPSPAPPDHAAEAEPPATPRA